MPETIEAKVELDAAQVQGFVGMMESGTQMVQQLWGNVAEYKKVASALDGFRKEVQDMLPNKDSWKHPKKARIALSAQLDYAERTLVRNTLDYLDARRDSFMAQTYAIPGVRTAKVTVMTKKGPMEVPFHKALEDHHTDIRKSILRHMNAYFRNVRYYTEILITGGEIPLFTLNEDSGRLDATG